MEALVYTKDDKEYETIKDVLETEAELIDVYRETTEEQSSFSHEYDIVVVALGGAQGMELVLEYSRRFYDTRLIWITDDSYFAGTAIRHHIYDFIQRPYDRVTIEGSIKNAVKDCPNRYRWNNRVSSR